MKRRTKSRMTSAGRRGAIAAALVLAVVSLFAAAGADQAALGANVVEIKVLSNRADLLSEGDALVQVTVPQGFNFATLSVDVDGQDVTSSFAVRADGRYLGRVEGLDNGPNVLTARYPNGMGAKITLTNYPKGGPIFSGPQVQPWICTTSSNGLGNPTDAQCNGNTVYLFRYVPEGGTSFMDCPTTGCPTTGVATTTTDQGKTVPFIIRQETGTANRGIYRIAVLYQPTKPFEPWDNADQGWNHKLFYPFGASCATSHTQSNPPNVQNVNRLGRGFMIASSSMNTLGNNCSTYTSAESVMMLKEHIVDRYGEIRFTFGEGGSGGSMGQHMTANTYPGLLQGLTVTISFPDLNGTVFSLETQDCATLVNYFTNVSPQLWTNAAQQTAVTDQRSIATCAVWYATFSSVNDPHSSCGVPGPPDGPGAYHEDTNRTGCRGTVHDFQFPVWGPRPPSVWNPAEQALGRGFARWHHDNVGVQFGLKALQQGLITTEQFVDLNEKIGGIDIDAHYTLGMRRTADPDATRIAYRTGAVNDGGQLDQVAIIDSRSQGDVDALGIHTMHHTFALKERIKNAHGTAANHIVWRGGAPAGGTFDAMDRWLTAVEADTSAKPLAQKIIDDKPADIFESCFIGGQVFTDPATCDAAWPYFGAPRTGAGMPKSHDVIKCALKPINRNDNYGLVPFTDLQWDRLKGSFTLGVCDWSKPGVDRVPSIPWLTYANGIGGGEPLPPPPVSVPLSPTAVTVSSFSASRKGLVVVLRWRTASELRTIGFNLYQVQTGKRTRLNPRLIATGAASHSYSWRGHVPARAARYLLEEVRRDGSRVFHGPVRTS